MAKVEKIVLDVNGKKMELDLEAARELHAILAELFDKKTVKEYIPYEPYRPWPWQYWLQDTYKQPSVAGATVYLQSAE